MNGSTLRLLDQLRLAGGSGRPDPQALEAFVLLVVGRTSVTSAERWWLTSIVDEAVTAPSGDRTAPFRWAYAAATELPISAKTSTGSGSLALEGLLGLPVPHRVTLALSCILGFTPSEVSSVIGLDPGRIKALLEDGIATIREAARPSARPAADGTSAA